MTAYVDRAVFLDRDGVVNEAILRDGKLFSPMTVDQLVLADGVVSAVETLASVAPVIIVTNQPEVARGRLDLSTLEGMHQTLRQRLAVSDIVFCPHDNDDLCPCRKPKPGMILESCQRLGLDPSLSVMVGDQVRDIQAGQAAGCHTVLVSDGRHRPSAIPDRRVLSLAEAVPDIIELLGGAKQ